MRFDPEAEITFLDGLESLIRKHRAKIAETFASKPRPLAQAFDTNSDDVDPDIGKIQFRIGNMSTGRLAVHTDARAWAFGFNKDGSIKEECQILIELLKRRGSYSDGVYSYTLSGKEKTFLNRKRL